MEYQQILSELKSKKYAPVYFLSGEEPYFIDAVSDYIEKNVLNEEEKDFNQTILYGKDTDILSLISAARRFPMMSQYQVIIIKEAQTMRDLLGRDKEGGKDQGSKPPLITYLENPQPSTLLVFCYKYKSIDKRTSAAKSLVKNSILLDSKKIYENKIPDWIASYLKEQHYTIGPKASMLITEYLGNDLSKIVNELDKLMISVPAKSEITIDHIQSNIGISKDYNVFELHGALGKKDILKANRIIQYFAANQKDNPLIVIMGSLYGYFSKLLAYHALSDKSKASVATALGVHPFFVGEYEQAARNYSLGKVKATVGFLREYDLRSKGWENESTSEGELLKELVFKILH